MRSIRPYPVTNYVNGAVVQVMPGIVFNTRVSGNYKEAEGVEAFDPGVELRRPEMQRLVVLREGELGDIVAALGGLRILRQMFPHISMTLAIHPRYMVMQHCVSDIALVMAGQHHRRQRGRDSLVIDFTGYFELDHHEGPRRENRVDRLLRVFGVEWRP